MAFLYLNQYPLQCAYIKLKNHIDEWVWLWGCYLYIALNDIRWNEADISYLGGVFTKKIPILRLNFPFLSSLNRYFAQIPLPNMIYLFRIPSCYKCNFLCLWFDFKQLYVVSAWYWMNLYYNMYIRVITKLYYSFILVCAWKFWNVLVEPEKSIELYIAYE